MKLLAFIDFNTLIMLIMIKVLGLDKLILAHEWLI